MSCSTYKHGIYTKQSSVCKVVSKALGMTMTEFCNFMIAEYQREHPEMMPQAQGFIATINSGVFSRKEEPEPEPTEEENPEHLAKKRRRRKHICHKWTAQEDAWIVLHASDATIREIAKQFSVSYDSARHRLRYVQAKWGITT